MQKTPSKLGIWTSTSLVIGNMIGAGVFLMPSTLAGYGAISLLGWVIAAIGALLIAKIFSNLSKLLPSADGGPYAYSQKGLGDFAGFLVAWGYWISVWCTNAAISVSLVSALSTFFPILTHSAIAAVGTGLFAIWILTWINTKGILASGKLQLVTTILKVIPLILIGIAGLFFFNIKNFSAFNTSGGSFFSAITATATLTFFAFLGLECATIPSTSIEDPDKTISKATMLGTIFTTLIYIISSISIMGMIPAQNLQHSVTPFADAAELVWGKGARYLISAGVAIAALGTLNGFILIQGQVPFAIAKDKLFPPLFARKNGNGVPALGIIISSVLVSVLMCMNYTKGLAEQFKFLILLSTLTSLIPYLFSTAAYIIIRVRKNFTSKSGWLSAILLSSFAFLFCLWMVIGSGQEIVYWGFVLLMSGIPFYVWVIWLRDKKN
jgi:APA family basic amino acid/polyamine antiporter